MLKYFEEQQHSILKMDNLIQNPQFDLYLLSLGGKHVTVICELIQIRQRQVKLRGPPWPN